MTLREKFNEKYPYSDIEMYCPSDFNWADDPRDCPECMDTFECGKCWDREIPETPTVVEPHILDSGNRTEFESGAVRDMREGKGRFDLTPLEVVSKMLAPDMNVSHSDLVIGNIALFKNKGFNTFYLYQALYYFAERAYDNSLETMFLEVAKHFEDGAKKYGENNWQKGIPVRCYIDSATRHYLKWRRGDQDEPHDRSFVWNLMCCIWEVDFHEKEET